MRFLMTSNMGKAVLGGKTVGVLGSLGARLPIAILVYGDRGVGREHYN